MTCGTGFYCYLSYHMQCVHINGAISNFLFVISSVPQGSLLGPILFISYVNNLHSSIISSNILPFADDAKLFKYITHLSHIQEFQNNLDLLYDWSVSNEPNFILTCLNVSNLALIMILLHLTKLILLHCHNFIIVILVYYSHIISCRATIINRY